MTWAKVDDRWPRHPKAIAVGPLGRDLYVCGLCYCNEHLTDGFIPDDAVATLALPGPGNHHNRFTSVSVTLQKLLDAHLWERVQGGYRVHDYLDWNPTAERIRELRQKKKNRQDRWRRDASRDASRGASRDASQRDHDDAPRDASRDAAPTPTPTTTAASLSRDASQNHRRDPRPREAFRSDCPDPRWHGHCVDAAFFAAHPELSLPVNVATGGPFQCPHHRNPSPVSPGSTPAMTTPPSRPPSRRHRPERPARAHALAGGVPAR